MPAKKKLSKKEKARLEAEQAELLRIEMEKERQKLIEEERQRRQVEREQAEKRFNTEISENLERRKQLKTSMDYFNNVKSVIDAINQRERERIEWEKYMRCNGLPNASCPSDLRRYMHMWEAEIKSRQENERNWLLKTNERSLLTQDCSVADYSRASLLKQQPNLGDLYAHRLKEVLGLLEEVNEAIGEPKQSISTRSDLIKLKMEIRCFLQDYLDSFTFSILSHVDRDMKPDRPGIFQHIYISDILKCQTYVISEDAQFIQKDIKMKSDEIRHTEIDFPALNIQITLPPSEKIGKCAFRGLWLNYDHFSDYCPTYWIPVVEKEPMDILIQSTREWRKRKEFLQILLDEASRGLSLEGFDPMSELEEPAPPRKSVDVDKMFNTYQDERDRIRRETIGPTAYKLDEFDVNLRKYRIIGGLYVVDYLEQPEQDKQLNSKTFTKTIVSPCSLVRKNFHRTYKPPPPPLPGVRRLPEEIEAEIKWIELNLEKLGSMTVELPDSVIWFEPPIACRWETANDISSGDENVSTVPTVEPEDDAENSQSIENTLKRCLDRPSPAPKTIKELAEKSIDDFDMYNIPPDLDIYTLLEEFVVPRLPEGYCVHIKCEPEKPATREKYILLARYKEDADAPSEDNQVIPTIPEILHDTGAPRRFHSKINLKKILKIKKSNTEQDPNDCGPSATKEVNKYSAPSNSTLDKPSARVYLFSQLLEDLDALCKLQMASWGEHVQEISLSPSASNSDDEDADHRRPAEFGPQRKLSTIRYTHETEAKLNDKPRTIDVKSTEIESISDCEDNEDFSKKQQIKDDSKNSHQGKLTNYNEAVPSMGKWSTRDVHDVKFNEDQLALQFRIGRLGIFGFALNRYCNMPYQTWEVKPDFSLDGAVKFSFTASIISFDMTITAAGYCVNSFQGGITDAINNMIGRPHSLAELKTILIGCGVDVFPDDDAFCYTEGSCEKDYIMEMHLYTCMSTLSLSHNFGWSRWNLLAGSRTAVILMRELVENKKPPTHSTLLVTPLRTTVIDSAEVSSSFNPVPAEGMSFYADLYQLSRVHTLPSSRLKQSTIDPILRDNVAKILMAIRPLSFC